MSLKSAFRFAVHLQGFYDVTLHNITPIKSTDRVTSVREVILYDYCFLAIFLRCNGYPCYPPESVAFGHSVTKSAAVTHINQAINIHGQKLQCVA